MLSTYIQARSSNPVLVRVVAIVTFSALTALSARATIHLPFTPVPITLQVFVVLLAGLVLGAKDGAMSQITYLTAITCGLPLDSAGLGAAAWAGPSAGYLIGFVAGAFVAGYLAEKGLNRNRVLRLLAGMAGVAALYLTGLVWLTCGFLAGDWIAGWTMGVAPFVAIDIAKAIIAALLAEGLWLRLGKPGTSD